MKQAIGSRLLSVAVLAMAIFVSMPAASASAAYSGQGVPTGKLPDWVVPQRYDVALRADPAEQAFTGEVTIDVVLKEAHDFVWLNGQNLDVTRVQATDDAGHTRTGRYHEVDTEAGVARIDFDRPLPAGTVRLHFIYSAPLNTDLQGFYRVDHQGAAYAMTQFEAVSARRTFPSFDQPDIKTPFVLHLTVPGTDRALANTPVARQTAQPNGWQRFDFKPTRPLPTYLVAFAVGPWDVVTGPTVAANRWRDRATPLRGIAARHRGAELKPALAQTPAMVTALEQYFDYGYPFEKLDVLAAPDFAAGAMENAGLITFRDWYMLRTPDSPAASRRDSFEVEAHELAHQWVGNTVTMAWWNDLWLNEAFATWMQQKITDQLKPAYHAGLDRITGAERAMNDDSLTTARRIRQPIETIGDIGNAFDSITYAKGAAVLGMFETFLGPDVFRQGMQRYIHQYAFRNATAEDLVATLAETAEADDAFGPAFMSFLNQSGVPYVRTTLRHVDGHAVLDVRQQRYLPLGSDGATDRRWGLPLCVRYPSGAGTSRTHCQLVTASTARMALPGAVDTPAWIMPNANAAGYYRFALDRHSLDGLLAHRNDLNDGEKIALADAALASFRQATLGPDALLATMQALAGAKTTAVATAPIHGLAWLWHYAADSDPARAHVQQAAAAAYLPRLKALGYARRRNESADAPALRRTLAEFLGVTLNVPAVADALAERGRAVLAPALDEDADTDATLAYDAVNPDLLAAALSVAARRNGRPAVEALENALRHNGDADQRNAMITALARIEDPELRETVRNFALTPHIKTGEMVALLSGGDRHGATARSADEAASMWHWFTTHFDAIKARTGPFSGGDLPGLAAGGACTVEAADRLEAFFTPRLDQLRGARRNLAQTAESIRLCAALAARQRMSVD
ncbi:M1 family metallopeptidase [Salinisphaera sp. Q1T1-3]|uniref:M1 family metallopeptidase n=1 Tax=Salinisphaera sp. Q1T1-3 TaxID=2321229 RepID=UPI000E7573B4|nr:M1 family aminopeptidase [Salinisphaera sp. Q1T1-3]RJS93245.1 M1 family peptidase [Salinisphaera sp. Q1T1-3]